MAYKCCTLLFFAVIKPHAPLGDFVPFACSYLALERNRDRRGLNCRAKGLWTRNRNAAQDLFAFFTCPLDEAEIEFL